MPSRSAVALAVNSGMVKCFIYFNVDVNDDDNFFLPLYYVREYQCGTRLLIVIFNKLTY